MEKKLLTITEASKRYSIDKWTLYRWSVEGKIPSRKIGKLRRLPLKELDKLFLGPFKGEEKSD